MKRVTDFNGNVSLVVKEFHKLLILESTLKKIRKNKMYLTDILHTFRRLTISDQRKSTIMSLYFGKAQLQLL